MNRELIFGAIDLSAYFHECKRIRGGLEIRLTNVPEPEMIELFHYVALGFNSARLAQALYVRWREWEYHIRIVTLYSLGEVWGKGKYCLELREADWGSRIYLKFLPVSEDAIYRIQNID